MNRKEKLEKMKIALAEIERDLSKLKEVKDLKGRIKCLNRDIEELEPKPKIARTRGDPVCRIY